MQKPMTAAMKKLWQTKNCRKSKSSLVEMGGFSQTVTEAERTKLN